MSVRLLIGSGPSAPQCLTCDLNPDRCQYNSAYFSADASYYRMDCYGESGHLCPSVLGSICEHSSEELISNLLFVHLLYQDLVCLSTPSETTGAQVQVSVSFAQKPVSASAEELHKCFDWLRLGPVNVKPFGVFLLHHHPQIFIILN